MKSLGNDKNAFVKLFVDSNATVLDTKQPLVSLDFQILPFVTLLADAAERRLMYRSIVLPQSI